MGPAAAYSAQVAQWLNQAYHAQMIQIGVIISHLFMKFNELITSGFPSFLAYQASLGRFNFGQNQGISSQSSQNANSNTSNNQHPQQNQQPQNINLNLNIPGMGMNINLPGVGMNLNLGNNGPNVPVFRATLVQVIKSIIFVPKNKAYFYNVGI